MTIFVYFVTARTKNTGHLGPFSAARSSAIAPKHMRIRNESCENAGCLFVGKYRLSGIVPALLTYAPEQLALAITPTGQSSRDTASRGAGVPDFDTSRCRNAASARRWVYAKWIRGGCGNPLATVRFEVRPVPGRIWGHENAEFPAREDGIALTSFFCHGNHSWPCL